MTPRDQIMIIMQLHSKRHGIIDPQEDLLLCKKFDIFSIYDYIFSLSTKKKIN